MLATKYRRRNQRQIGHRAKSARRSFAFTKPKASAPKLHHPDVATSKSKTPEQKRSRVLESPISNGASPVASALGIRLGATPRGPHQLHMASPARRSKQDVSTLLGIGHFYFALTPDIAACSGTLGNMLNAEIGRLPGIDILSNDPHPGSSSLGARDCGDIPDTAKAAA